MPVGPFFPLQAFLALLTFYAVDIQPRILPTKWRQTHNRIQIQIIPVTREGRYALIKLWLPVIVQMAKIAN